MKLYVVNLDMTTLNVEKIKKKMLAKNNNAATREMIVKKIYSENGIIEIDKYGKLWNIEIISDLEPCVYKLNENTRLYIDKSIVRRKDEAFQIVPEHIFVVIKKVVFSLSPKSIVQFVVEMENENIRDVYFESEIDIQQHYVREDILTFLTLLNFQ